MQSRDQEQKRTAAQICWDLPGKYIFPALPHNPVRLKHVHCNGRICIGWKLWYEHRKCLCPYICPLYCQELMQMETCLWRSQVIRCIQVNDAMVLSSVIYVLSKCVNDCFCFVHSTKYQHTTLFVIIIILFKNAPGSSSLP